VALMRCCVDTSAYSQFKRGDHQVVELLDRADWVGVPVVVLGELWLGFLLGRRAARNQEELAAFIDHAAVETLAVDEEVAKIYAELVVDLRKAGTPLPTNDIWVAATAARAGATVLTYDAHFTAIKRVGSLVLAAPP
jgi:tRNA(fMet)-specific endonuclease VapC